MSTAAENKIIKRSKILDAAFNLFTSKTVNCTAIDDVVKAAGVAKGTFYLYFKDKYDLLDQIILHNTSITIEKIMTELKEEQSEKEMTYLEKFMFLIDRFTDYMKDNRELIALIDKNRTMYVNAVLKIETDDFKIFADESMKYFEDMGSTEEQAKKSLFLIVSMISSVCCDTIINEKPYTIDELKPELKEMVAKMINREVSCVD